MKKIIGFMALLLLTILLVACNDKKEPPVLDDDLVVFDTQGGSLIEPVQYEEPFLLQAPAFPVKEGYVFNGWFRNEELSQIWDFENDYVTGGMKLYAKWKKEVAEGYQVRIIFVVYDNKGNYTVEKRSENLTGTIDLLEEVNYGEFDYIAFNISKLKVGDQTNEDIDISEMLDELVTKIEFK